MYSQIWLNVLVNDHQFGYITELKKEKKNTEQQYVTSHLFLGAVFPFLSFKIKNKTFSFFLLDLYRCPIPPLPQLPLRFHFTFFPEWSGGRGETPQVPAKTKNSLNRRFCTTNSTGLVLQQRY